MLRRSIFAAAFCAASFFSAAAENHAPAPVSRIVVASCLREQREQPVWDAIVAAKPELFLFIGDCIYGDTRDMAVLKAKWAKLESGEGFKKVRAACPMLATWDDHDFGENDAGAEYPMKKESQQLFLDFCREPADSPRRRQEGVYMSALLGPPEKAVQIILLDTRYFRTPTKDGAKEGATILGEAQWKWLYEQLKAPAKLRIIASSIQVLFDEAPCEKWANFPAERAKLFKLLKDTAAEGVLFVSGDRHFSEIARMDAKDSGLGYPVYDFTCSSLNQTGSKKARPNRYRISPDHYTDPNFGLIAIDWTQPDPRITLEIRDVAGKELAKHELKLGELSRK